MSTEETFKFSCPHCNEHISATPEWYGKVTNCPHCSKKIEVPYPPAWQERIGAVPAEGELRTVVMQRTPRQTGPKPPARTPSVPVIPPQTDSTPAPSKPWWRFW